MVDLSQKAKQAGRPLRVGVVPANPKSIPILSRSRSLPTSTSTSARQTERLEDAFNQRARPLLIRCCFRPSRRPAVRPSTSMINCRSMHFKNVNLSYMPRSIRLCPKRKKKGDRQIQRAEGQTESQGMEWKICVRKCFRRAAEIKLKMYNR